MSRMVHITSSNFSLHRITQVLTIMETGWIIGEVVIELKI